MKPQHSSCMTGRTGSDCIAGRFTAVDAGRGFKVMQTALEAINQLTSQRAASESTWSNSGAAGEFETGDLYGSSFEATFAALGRADFEGAWSLAQQLTAGDVSVLAQLAACRGGLEVLVPHKKVPHILQETGQ